MLKEWMNNFRKQLIMAVPVDFSYFENDINFCNLIITCEDLLKIYMPDL